MVFLLEDPTGPMEGCWYEERQHGAHADWNAAHNRPLYSEKPRLSEAPSCINRPFDGPLRHDGTGKERGRISAKPARNALLYAALNNKSGEVMGKTAAHHTSQEFVAFLADLVANQPRGKEIHLIADHLSAHKTKRVEQFLAAHPKVHLHYTPTYY